MATGFVPATERHVATAADRATKSSAPRIEAPTQHSWQFSLKAIFLIIVGISAYLALLPEYGLWLLIPAAYIPYYALLAYHGRRPSVGWLVAAQSSGLAWVAGCDLVYNLYGGGLVFIASLTSAAAVTWIGAVVLAGYPKTQNWLSFAGLAVATVFFCWNVIPFLDFVDLKCEVHRVSAWAELQRERTGKFPKKLSGYKFRNLDWKSSINYWTWGTGYYVWYRTKQNAWHSYEGK